MARNIPLVFVKHQWDADNNFFVLEPNPGFISRLKDLYAPTDTLLVMCRSGARSAKAVNALANVGFVNVYTIIDGMEGDTVDDPGSISHGKRMKNGWKIRIALDLRCEPRADWATGRQKIVYFRTRPPPIT